VVKKAGDIQQKFKDKEPTQLGVVGVREHPQAAADQRRHQPGHRRDHVVGPRKSRSSARSSA